MPLGEDDLGAVGSVAVRHQPVIQQPVQRAGHRHRIGLGQPGRRHHGPQGVTVFGARGFGVGAGTVEEQHRQRQRKALSGFGSHHPPSALPRPLRVDVVELAESADHTEVRVVQFALEGRRTQQTQGLTSADGEQHRGADDLAGPQVGRESGLLARGGVFEAQPVQRAVQLHQVLAFARVCRTAAAAEDLTESFGGDDQRVIEGLEVGGEQPVGFVVVDHERLQRGRPALGGGPVEADLAVGLDDARSHGRDRCRQIITRLLPLSATASRSPRTDSP